MKKNKGLEKSKKTKKAKKQQRKAPGRVKTIRKKVPLPKSLTQGERRPYLNQMRQSIRPDDELDSSLQGDRREPRTKSPASLENHQNQMKDQTEPLVLMTKRQFDQMMMSGVVLSALVVLLAWRLLVGKKGQSND